MPISPTPPKTIDYYHLEVPDGVADHMDATKVHDELHLKGSDIKIAMVDTGFCMDPTVLGLGPGDVHIHPYYAAQNYNKPEVDAAPGVNPDTDPMGHGTAISACTLAVAPDVTFKVFKWPKIDGQMTDAQIYEGRKDGFKRAVAWGPDIIACAWGVAVDDAFRKVVLDAIDAGIVVLFAVGNTPQDTEPLWPSCDAAVISVGGVYINPDGSLEASNRTLSGRSKNAPYRVCPDLCGICGRVENHAELIAEPTQPGSELDERFANFTDHPDLTEPKDGWLVFSGSSSATAMVAGVAALVMQAAWERAKANDPEITRKDAVTPAEVWKLLELSCVDIVAGTSGSDIPAAPGFDEATGYGLVSAYRACTIIPPPRRPWPHLESEVAIDALFWALKNEKVALILRELHQPRPGYLPQLRQELARMNSQERRQLRRGLRAFGDTAAVLNNELDKAERAGASGRD